jgi:predicted dehydrogenase
MGEQIVTRQSQQWTSAPTPPRSVTVAIVGCGHWGPNHIRCFQRIHNCSVIAVDKLTSRLERISQEYPHIKTSTDYDSVLAEDSVDAVVIATPTASHVSLVRKALEAGKHVLCEKPLCLFSRDADELSAFARSKSLVLMVGHVFLFNSGILKIKELIDQRELGKMLYLSAERTNLGPIRDDVNAAYDLASHDIAVFNWLLNAEPETVSATGGVYVRPGIHDVVFISLRYPGGCVGHIHASWLNPLKVRKMTLVGDRRMVTWNDLELSTPVAIFDRGAMIATDSGDFGEFQRETMWDGEVRLPKVDSMEPLRLQDQEFIEAIRTGHDYRSHGPFSSGVVLALEMVSQSLANQGSPVTKMEVLHGS